MTTAEDRLNSELAKYQYRDVYGSVGERDAVYSFVNIQGICGTPFINIRDVSTGATQEVLFWKFIGLEEVVEEPSQLKQKT